MQRLLGDMAELQLIRDYTSKGGESLDKGHELQFSRGQWVGGLYQPGSSSVEEFEHFLKQIRSDGEQFSGTQLVSLVQAIPKAPLRGPYFEKGNWKGNSL